MSSYEAFHEEILIKIHTLFPELIIQQERSSDKYQWSFRCLTSEDMDLPNDRVGFDCPVEALAHFAWFINQEADKFLDNEDEDDQDDSHLDIEELN